MARFLLIRNARAGRRFAGGMAAVDSYLRARGASVKAVNTPSLEALDTLLAREGLHRHLPPPNGEERARYDALIAAGGDGTVRALAERLSDEAPPLAPLAMGGGNYLARELGMARQPEAFAQAVFRRESDAIAVGEANGTAFTLIAGVGLDGRAAALTPGLIKAVSARAAYGVAIVSAWAQQMAVGRDFPVFVDGAQTRARWVMVTNARLKEPRLRLGQGDAPHLHALLVRPRGPWDIVDVLRRLALGGVAPTPALEVRQCTQVRVEDADAQAVHGDGEVIGHAPVTFTAARTLKIIRPL